MIKQAQFEIIRIPYTNDPIDIQAIILIVDKAIHVFINDASILKGIKTIEVSRAIHEMLDNSVHGRAHEYYINIVIADSERQLIDTFIGTLNAFNIQVLLTWTAEWTYKVFENLEVEGLKYIYDPDLFKVKQFLGFNGAFRFGTHRKIYVADGIHRCFIRLPKQSSYIAQVVINELLGKEYYKELDAYKDLSGLAYTIKAITDSPCEYIAADVFNTLSIRTLVHILTELT